jgi:diguanylate cyclase (GGDEF)-like protein
MKVAPQYSDARVLIVDDQPDVVALLRAILSRAGYQNLMVTHDPCAALELYLREQPDVVLLDYNMPQRNGLEVLAELKAAEPDAYLPVLMLTAREDRATKLAALEAGVKDFLTKPFDKLEALVRIRQIIEGCRLHRALRAQNRTLDEAVRERTRDLQTEMLQRQQAEERVRFQALHDAVTGLPNRALLCERLQQNLQRAERANRHVAVLLVDLSRFQEINNTLGHANGDLLLRRVGGRLESCLRRGDTVARLQSPADGWILAHLGGNQFAIVAAQLAAAGDAAKIAERIRNALRAPFEIEGLGLEIGASLGIALAPEHGSDVETLLRRADVALYAAKLARLDYVVYAPEHDQFSPLRLTLMAELRRAIADNALTLNFQPKVDLASGRVQGLEALVRWVHPGHGFIPPDQFIPMAEETGTIKLLTRWVLNAAAAQAASLRREGFDLNMAVNLSAHDLLDPLLPERVMELLAHWKLEPSSLTLEVTESAMMEDPQQALAVITRLSGAGVSFAIDDFGTGYSSLGYLKQLPVHEVKIDRSFVMDMADDASNAMIVHSIVELAHNLGLKVVAEGVENAAGWELLHKLACDTAQGYYMSRPLAADALSAWLHESAWRALRAAS